MAKEEIETVCGYHIYSCLVCGDTYWSLSCNIPAMCKECHDTYKHKAIKRTEEWNENLSKSNRKEVEYIVNDDGCYIDVIHKGRDWKGYLRIACVGKYMKIHRWAYELVNDVILSKEQVVMHLCDNSECFNLNHLKLGTLVDNNLDMKLKKRHAWGERNNFAKLMEKDVLRIRESAGNFKELAKSFGVSVATIYDIKARRSWDNLEG